MIKVVVVDDHELVRGALSAILDTHDEIEVVGAATNGKEAIAVVEALQPDVVIMDIAMPQMDGITATEKIVASDGRRPRVIMLSMYASSDLVEQALKKGAIGYLLKQSAVSELVGAVVAVSKGRSYLGAGIPS